MTYEEVLAKVNTMADLGGVPVDEGIKSLVAALTMNGFTTTQSCEGHMSHGLPYPWVDIGKHTWIDPKDDPVVEPRILQLQQDMMDAFSKAKVQLVYSGITDVEGQRYFLQVDRKGGSVKKSVSMKYDMEEVWEQQEKISNLLEIFYSHRATAYIDRIALQYSNGNGSFRLQIMGGDFVIHKTVTAMEGALARFRQEMDDFATFLISSGDQ